MNTLTAEQLAAETESTPERIAALVEAGVLQPPAGGAFERGDVPRVLVANALEESGLSLELMRRGIEAGVISFDGTPEMYPDPGPPGRTLQEVAADCGLSPDALLRVITAFGLPRPDLDARLRRADEEQLVAFVGAWSPLGDETILVHAARIYGNAIRRITEGWIGLFERVVLQPIGNRVVPWEEMRQLAMEPGLRVLAVASSMLPWLFDRHRVPELNRLNLDSIEGQLAALGIAPAAAPQPSAMLFADLVGYTNLTEEHGDEVAASYALRLADIADEVAKAHDGRLVKLLGDGVMLHFARPPDAVAAALALRAAVVEAGLPPAHIGIAAGAVVRREADYFGRTVNVAARLSVQAGAGEILMTDAVAAAAAAPGAAFDDAGELTLKGIPEPVRAFVVRRPGDR